jgi:hypothetical protein
MYFVASLTDSVSSGLWKWNQIVSMLMSAIVADCLLARIARSGSQPNFGVWLMQGCSGCRMRLDTGDLDSGKKLHPAS